MKGINRSVPYRRRCGERKDLQTEANRDFTVSSGYKWTLAITAALIILLGAVPSLLIDWMYY